MYFKPFESN